MESLSYFRLSSLSLEHILTTAVLIAASPSAMSQQSFTAVRAQIEMGYPVIETMSAETFAQAGEASSVYAKARAGFGNNGAFAIATNNSLGLEAFGESIWMDGFNVTGGIGSAEIQINVLVSGTLDGRGTPGGSGSNSYYVLFTSGSPMSCNFDDVSCTGAVAISSEAVNGSRLFTASIPFTYGQTFYIASYLGAEVRYIDGYADFYGSARFGATAPNGVPLIGSSGTNYVLASSVPEPSTLMLSTGGLLAILSLLRSPNTHSLRRKDDA